MTPAVKLTDIQFSGSDPLSAQLRQLVQSLQATQTALNISLAQIAALQGTPSTSGGATVTSQPTSGAAAYNAAFGSGAVQYAGPNGSFAGNINFLYGTKLPNPAGGVGPGVTLGSGPGVVFFITTDQAYTVADPGNDLIDAAGETQPLSAAAGGNRTSYGGASYYGRGGAWTGQGGTSYLGDGGPSILAGGNATSGGQPGDAYVIGGFGANPSQGANVHLIATQGNTPVPGVIRFRLDSTIVIDFFVNNGAIYLYLGGGFGTAGQKLTSQGPGLPVKWA